MPDTLTVEDVQEETVERGADGELIPEEHVIQWGDGEKKVKTKPITTGVINQLSHIEEGILELEPSAVKEAMEEIYVEPDASQFSATDLQDLPFTRLKALMKPIDKRIKDEVGGAEAGEGNQPART